MEEKMEEKNGENLVFPLWHFFPNVRTVLAAFFQKHRLVTII